MEGLSESQSIAWFVVFILEGTVIILCNTISLIVFSRRARNSKPCLLLINQSFADLLVGLEAIFYCLRFVSSYFKKVDEFPRSKGCATTIHTVRLVAWNFAVELSLSSLAIIALDRAFAVFKPFRHRMLKSKQYYYCILGTWMLSSIPSIVIVSMRCEDPKLELAVALSLASVIVLCTLMILVLAYTSVYIKVRFFSVFQNDSNSHARSQIKLSLTLFLASAASMATVLPSFGIQMIMKYHHEFKHSTHLAQVAVFLVIANSFINFIIYAWRFPEFVENMKKLFCCKK